MIYHAVMVLTQPPLLMYLHRCVCVCVCVCVYVCALVYILCMYIPLRVCVCCVARIQRTLLFMLMIRTQLPISLYGNL